ncbi:Uncharacterised protein [Klebsiella pneumoniae]|nr:Uncharacterised protein [Klebsiella pneumoniae]
MEIINCGLGNILVCCFSYCYNSSCIHCSMGNV